MRRALTEGTYSRREAIAHTASIALGERLSRLRELSLSFAGRVHFRELVAQGEFERAIVIMRQALADFPIVDRIFVVDTSGVLRADVPSFPEMKGRSLADRDWFLGVSRTQSAYISNIYRRGAVPRKVVLAAAAPIRTDLGKIVGYLVLQVEIARAFDWVREIDVGQSGYVYIIDRTGNVAMHPGTSDLDGLVNFSQIPSIRNLLAGRDGIGELQDPVDHERELAAYASVQGYGWGVVVQQPPRAAFTVRRESLGLLLFVYALTLLISCGLGYLALRLARSALARREAERQVELRDEFITAAAHELRTPLTALRMQIQVLPKVFGSPDLARAGRFAELINKSLVQLDNFSKWVEELLDTSRITSGALPLKREPADLAEIARSAVEQFRGEAEKLGSELILSLKSVWGIWDPIRLQQVIGNLLSNAIKYGKGKPIRVDVHEADGKAIITVEDRGIGISKEDQERIFNRFERAASIDQYRGLGLGLYLAKRIVLAHEGSLRVESLGKNQGSKFIVELKSGLRKEGAP